MIEKPHDFSNTFLQKCIDACAVPHKYGHGDLGERFVMLIQGKITEEEAIRFIDVTYLGKDWKED